MVKTTSKSKMLIGRRKTAVSKVLLTKGSGKIEVNGKNLEDYFNSEIHQLAVKQPLLVTQTLGKYDIKIDVSSGGLSGQADSAKLGVARALTKENEDFRNVLKKAGLLTCDSRQKERKKYGQKKARKRFQFSKR